MSFKYKLTQDAQADLKDIQQYTLKTWGKNQATKYLAGLKESFELISEQPFIGHKFIDIADSVYGFPYKKHQIYYFIADKNIIIFAVLHQRMLPEKHLAKRKIN